ncbi:hypothetical protein INR49_006378 [Caranx melampygus]|nr:hypothetical protein INR49_006378 [Caranx melampygus]
MDGGANSDLFFLNDEKFDFDVSLSPASSKGDEDEDEVFVGPVSHKERCVSVHFASRLEDSGGGVRASWSPLTGDQLEAVCQEAHRVATQLQSSDQPSQVNDQREEIATDAGSSREEFVQDAEAKLGVFSQTASALSPIKRQTFCVQDSPMKQLPPAIQQRLRRGSSTTAASSTRPAATNRPSSTRPASIAPSTRPTTRRSTSSPIAAVKAQPKMVLRGKAALGVVLPSKPAAPPTSCSASKSKVEKTRLQPPSKAVGGWRRSPTSRPSSRAESSEDLLSDSASVASDISDCSLNSSQLGKRSLAPPTKTVMRNLPGVKAPAPQSRRVTDRRKTSSSSSSVSSFNSSMSLSPAKGKLNSSLNQSLSGSTGPAPSINRPASQSRPRRSTAYTAAEQTSSAAAGRRSISAQARNLSEAERLKPNRSTPLKRAEATPLQTTPAKRILERTTSVPSAPSVRVQSGLKAKAKPEAVVVPAPSGDVSKNLRPKRLMSVDSPTPAVPQEAEPEDTPVIQPFCLEEEQQQQQAPAAPLPTPSPPELSEDTDLEVTANQSPSEPIRNLIELETTGEINSKAPEVLLLDLPAPALQPQEKLLIDLTNTPDLIRTSTKSCTTTQLIDLSSPLIKWSPEDKRENSAPLINLSF